MARRERKSEKLGVLAPEAFRVPGLRHEALGLGGLGVS